MAKRRNLKFIILGGVVVAGVYLYMNMGGMITRTAENIASDALGVKVNIGSVDVSLSDKRVMVDTLEVSNPPGYSGKHAMTADKVIIGLNTASSDLVDFDKIEVKGSVVNLEVNEKGMNLTDLKALAARKEQKESVGSEQVRVIIKHMVIDASVINPRITMMRRDLASIRMPAMTFNNIGKDGGMQAGEAIDKVMMQYLSAVERAARSEGLVGGLPGLGDVEKGLEDAAEGFKGLLR
ncbi:MAG: hypothetical protein AB7L92_00745 [Alphaproteobacteria bacterium]